MITFPQTLLTVILWEKAFTSSVQEMLAFSTFQYSRSVYMVRVLEASQGIRDRVRLAALASDSQSIQMIGYILANFELLPPEKKADFIDSFKAISTLASVGPIEIVRDQIWQHDHVPPVCDP